jgi:peptidoglycan/LPS O-acetylase OafA/YrhL
MFFMDLRTESKAMLHLDSLRFIAAMAIVLYHWREYWLSKTSLIVSSHMGFLSMAVDLFFIISGIVMYYVYSDRLSTLREFGVFLNRRFARLYPLHLLTFLFMVVYSLAVHVFHFTYHHPEIYGRDSVLPTLFLYQSFGVITHLTFNAPAWSISAEIFCYICLPAILYLQQHNKWSTIFLSLILLASLFCYCGGEWTEWTFHYGMLRALPSFVFGVFLGGSKPLLRGIPYPSQLLAASGILFVVLGYFDSSRCILLAIIYLIATFAYASDLQASSHLMGQYLAKMGSLTYSIYMLHGPIQPLIYGYMFPKLHLGTAVNDVCICLCVFPLLLLSYYSFMYVERPARRWLSGRKTLCLSVVAGDVKN